MIKVEIIKDSINPFDVRLTTWILTYPRFIHSEFMTHRCLSKNAASSRAIPVERMINDVDENTAYPERWGKTGKGMQDHGELDETSKVACMKWWRHAKNLTVGAVKKLLLFGLHKQVANRLLEPFSHMTIICSGTDWENFFQLRAHEDAQPEFSILAHMMLEEYNKNSPSPLATGQWHIPFEDRMPEGVTEDEKLQIAVARCARVSYMTFDGKIDKDKDLDLFNMLKKSGHFSPFEHVALSTNNSTRNSNFGIGWTQFRKTLPNECKTVDSRIKKHSYAKLTGEPVQLEWDKFDS